MSGLADLEKGMADAIGEMELNINGDGETDNEFQKGFDFDLETSDTGDDEFDVCMFLKGMATVSERNNGRVASAIESIARVVVAQSTLLKSMAQKIEVIDEIVGNAPVGGVMNKAIMNKAQADRAVAERQFGSSHDDIFNAADTDARVIGPFKEMIVSDLRKGIENGGFDRLEVLNFSCLPSNTPVDAILRSYSAPVVAVIQKYVG